jgi:hypothetical protein
MERNREKTLEHLLHLLSLDELRQVYTTIRMDQLDAGYSRSFIISKIRQKITIKDLFANELSASLLLSKFDELSAFVEKTISNLEKVDVIRIYEEYTSEKPNKRKLSEDLGKTEIIRYLLTEVSIPQIISSQRFKKASKSKTLSVDVIKSLEGEVLKSQEDISRILNRYEMMKAKVFDMARDFKDFSEKTKSVEAVFDVENIPSLYDFLGALYDEAASLNSNLSPEVFKGVLERLKTKTGTDDRTFMIKGLQLLLVHYFLTNVKLLRWKPRIGVFLKIFKEEYEASRPVGQQAKIPILRERVCRRMGIDEGLFDELLIEASKEGFVGFEMGQPIGEFNIKYLEKDGLRYYYVRLLK